MFCHTNCDPPAAGVSYRIVSVPATGEATVTVKLQQYDDTAVSYPAVIKQQVTVIETPEIEEPRPKPIRNPAYKPSVHEISNPWQAKWRLTQQRARDGLR